MIHLGAFFQQSGIVIPVSPADMAGMAITTLLTTLIGLIVYLLKRALDTIKEIESRVSGHTTSITLHDVRIGSLEERIRA